MENGQKMSSKFTRMTSESFLLLCQHMLLLCQHMLNFSADLPPRHSSRLPPENTKPFSLRGLAVL